MGLGGSVAGTRTVEVAEHVDDPLLERATQGDQFGLCLGTLWLTASIS